MADKKISDLTAFTGTIANLGTALMEIAFGGASYKLTLAQLWTYIRGLVTDNQGSLEYTIEADKLSNGNDTTGYTTYTNPDLIGKVNLTLIFLDSDKIHRTERTFNSTTGAITLTSGVVFRANQILYIEFKKA